MKFFTYKFRLHPLMSGKIFCLEDIYIKPLYNLEQSSSGICGSDFFAENKILIELYIQFLELVMVAKN